MTLLELACAARRDYVPHSAAMLHSVLEQTGPGVRIHFLHGGDWPAGYEDALAAMVESLGGTIAFLEVSPEMVEGLRTRDGLPAAHWYRIFLPQLLPDVTRVLYLDGDLVALESLEPLWAHDLGEHYLGAVTNVLQHDHVHRPAELGIPPRQGYFNSGVLLMNLELMRRDDCTAAVIGWAEEHWDRLAWPEQDALNAVLGDRRLALHPRWNFMNAFLVFPWAGEVLGERELAEARSNPAIRHFEGPTVNKPWHYLCDRGMRELYFSHRQATPWPDYELEGATLTNRLRRARRALRRRAA